MSVVLANQAQFIKLCFNHDICQIKMQIRTNLEKNMIMVFKILKQFIRRYNSKLC